MGKKGKISHDLMDKLYQFWDKFIQSYESDPVKQDTVRAINVFDFLKSSWRADLSIEDLRKIQLKVEEMTYQLKGTSYIENTPQLKTIFFQGISAKRFLLESLDDEHLLKLVRASPSWGVEPHVILVLSKHFNVFSLEKKGVLVATLIEDLDKEVRKYLNSFDEMGDNTPKEAPKARKKRGVKKPKPDQVYTLGRILVNWLLNKELLSIYQSDVDIKTSSGYLLNPSYAAALFDIKLLPLNVTLPMVHPPLDWKNRRSERSGPDQKIRLGQLTGGYLYSDPKLAAGKTGRGSPLLSSHDETKFDMRMHGDTQTRKVTSVLNKLQGVPFQINILFLNKLNEDWDHFQKYGLVLPKILCSIDRQEGLRRLQQHFNEDEDISDNFKFRELSKLLLKNITEANYQQNILYLADAYQGYYMYFPCFMDFRGRNYRFGPFHFHERDLVRSLIVFGEPGENPDGEDMERIFKNHKIATFFHLTKRISNYSNALTNFDKLFVYGSKLFCKEIDEEVRYGKIYEYAYHARHPFQFISFFQMLMRLHSEDDTESLDAWYHIVRE